MRAGRIILALCGALGLAVGAGAAWLKLTEPRLDALPPLRNGDVLFQSARSDQALAILLATRSLYTHVGLVEVDPDGKIYVIQASDVVERTPLADWIRQSYGERLTITRFPGLDGATAARIAQAAEHYEGRPYDLFFRLAPDRIYCSELIYHAFQDGAGISLGRLQPIGALGIDNFAVRKIIKARWRLDPDCQAASVTSFAACYAIIQRRLIITPVSLARDARLQTLYDNY
ncbi:MAG TPA: YiiX/YebB-like N1pC/P60 family cysteine hydrolase [Acidocella sp.]|nr:YiiX/YebB-like N1pC/P60 family cysteine hydrolase [Acidocella sp.]